MSMPEGQLSDIPVPVENADSGGELGGPRSLFGIFRRGKQKASGEGRGEGVRHPVDIHGNSDYDTVLLSETQWGKKMEEAQAGQVGAEGTQSLVEPSQVETSQAQEVLAPAAIDISTDNGKTFEPVSVPVGQEVVEGVQVEAPTTSVEVAAPVAGTPQAAVSAEDLWYSPERVSEAGTVGQEALAQEVTAPMPEEIVTPISGTQSIEEPVSEQELDLGRTANKLVSRLKQDMEIRDILQKKKNGGLLTQKELAQIKDNENLGEIENRLRISKQEAQKALGEIKNKVAPRDLLEKQKSGKILKQWELAQTRQAEKITREEYEDLKILEQQLSDLNENLVVASEKVEEKTAEPEFEEKVDPIQLLRERKERGELLDQWELVQLKMADNVSTSEEEKITREMGGKPEINEYGEIVRGGATSEVSAPTADFDIPVEAPLKVEMAEPETPKMELTGEEKKENEGQLRTKLLDKLTDLQKSKNFTEASIRVGAALEAAAELAETGAEGAEKAQKAIAPFARKNPGLFEQDIQGGGTNNDIKGRITDEKGSLLTSEEIKKKNNDGSLLALIELLISLGFGAVDLGVGTTIQQLQETLGGSRGR